MKIKFEVTSQTIKKKYQICSLNDLVEFKCTSKM